MEARVIPTNGARENRRQNWNGIKFFDGKSLPQHHVLFQQVETITVDQLREEMKVWRPEETVEAGKIFFYQGRVNIVGPPQSGKGTILFGLSGMCDMMGIGYVFIDGHHQKVEGGIVANTMGQAQEMNIPVFYDSTDYLWLKSRTHGRTINTAAQENRVPIIISAIDKLTVPIAITCHDEEWANGFLNLGMRTQSADALTRFPRYEIPLYLQSDASVMRFLKDHGISQKVAQYFLDIPTNSQVADILKEHFSNIRAGDSSIPEDAKQMVFSGLRTYPVLKELVRDRGQRLDEIMRKILGSNQQDQSAIQELGLLILQTEQRRQILTQLRKTKKSKIR